MYIKVLLSILLFSLVKADTIEFKNGAVLDGKVTKQNDATLTIEIDDKTTTYSKSDIKNIELEVVASPPPAPPPSPKSNGVITLESGTKNTRAGWRKSWFGMASSF